MIANQVTLEFNEHVQRVQDEAAKSILKLKAQVERIDGIAAVYGSLGTANLIHLDDHVKRARDVVDRWMQAAIALDQHADIPVRAFARLNLPRTPARKGKDSMKDCVVIESYIDLANRLRPAGLQRPMVFVSSNTKDYAGETGSVLRPDLAAEFGAIGMEYAPNLAAAKHLLGM